LTAPRLGFGRDDEIRKFHPVRLLHQGVRVEPLILQLAGDRLLEPTEYLARSPDMSSGPEPGEFRRPWPIGSFRFNCEDGKKPIIAQNDRRRRVRKIEKRRRAHSIWVTASAFSVPGRRNAPRGRTCPDQGSAAVMMISTR
jgi:hypothetical protein